MMTTKMKVEVWGDVTCTFCYTAKRKFDEALSQFKYKDKIEIVWKSFEVAPELKTDPDKRFPRFLSELKKIDLKQAEEMIDQVAESVRETGLTMDLHNAIPANSFNAHRLLHLAQQENMLGRAQEVLFKAYFSEGRNIDDIPTLIRLAHEIGLDAAVAESVFAGTEYTDVVRQDIYQAKEAGISSVPFFVFNKNTSVSGAQESKVYLETLKNSFTQWQLENREQAKTEITGGQSCEIGEDCK
jgi:predicted DsbA family dithiol-disulfide isomerase